MKYHEIPFASPNILHSSLPWCGMRRSASGGLPSLGSLACWFPVYGASGKPHRKTEREEWDGSVSLYPYLFGVASLVDPMPSAATGSYAPIPQPLLHVFTLTGCWSGSPQPCPLKHRDGNSFLLLLVSWHLSIPYLFPYPAHTSVGSLSPTSPDTD